MPLEPLPSAEPLIITNRMRASLLLWAHPGPPPFAGRQAGTWLTQLLGSSSILPMVGLPAYRLLRAADGVAGRRAGLSDVAPLLVLCEESVTDLNSRRAASGLPPVSMARFRPNLVSAPQARQSTSIGLQPRVGSRDT